MLKCPKSEKLLEYVSIREEMTLPLRLGIGVHCWRCHKCKAQVAAIQKSWSSIFAPEPDVTSSLLRVYSKLQNDQTLILKGWKLDTARPVQRTVRKPSTMIWPAAAGFAVAALLTGGSLFQWRSIWNAEPLPTAAVSLTGEDESDSPLAQVRIEDKNSVKVQYVRPQLLQTIEFETDHHK